MEELLLGAAEREVIGLPWADADLTAFGSSGGAGTSVLAQAITRGREQFADMGVSAEAVVWPAPSGVTSTLLGETAGSTGAVLTETVASEVVADAPLSGVDGEADGAAQSDLPPATTPSALGAVDTPSGRVPVLVADAWLGEILAGEVSDAVGAGTSAALAQRQLLLAQTAVIAREDRSERTVLAALDRETAAGLTAERTQGLAAATEALLEAPWITSGSLTAALQAAADGASSAASAGATTAPEADSTAAAADSDVRLVTLPDLTTVDTSAYLTLASGIEHTRSDLNSLASGLDPADGLDPARSWTWAATASAWRTSGTTGEDALAASRAVIDDLTAQVSVSVPESQVNLLAEESAVPVVVTNDLPVTLTARIVVDPQEQSLRAPEEPEVTLGPGETTTVRVPVVAIANGTTPVDVSLYTPDGLSLGQAETFDMRVRAEWESVGIGIVAAVFGVLLVIGIVRAARRGRRRADGHVPPRRAGGKA